MKPLRYIVFALAAAVALVAHCQEVVEDTDSAVVATSSIPVYYFMPAIFDNYTIMLPADDFNIDSIASGEDNLSWLDREVANVKRLNRMRQDYMINHPDEVRYNIKWMPEPPKKYHAVVDPSTNLLTVEELTVDRNTALADGVDIEQKKRHWIHGFDGSLQFSQAYLSPNWYQGGNNNVNMLLNAAYSVKLNPAFHPNLMFENSIIYKLAMNSTPDDSIHHYNISEDLLQINSKFGVRAAKKWFYSLALQFKTQIFNGYNINSSALRSAFLSPGELNLGVGMTYNHKSPSGRVTFDVTVSALSYNLKTCINERMDPTTFGITAGRKSTSQFGSSLEAKTVCKITRNITYTGRLFAFTDYHYLQGDFENTFSFSINRFLSTQIYAHLRYDGSQAKLPDSKWGHWQFKEILSFGFAYKFSMI